MNQDGIIQDITVAGIKNGKHYKRNFQLIESEQPDCITLKMDFEKDLYDIIEKKADQEKVEPLTLVYDCLKRYAKRCEKTII